MIGVCVVLRVMIYSSENKERTVLYYSLVILLVLMLNASHQHVMNEWSTQNCDY